MLRRRYHPKKETPGEAKGRQEADAPVRDGAGAQRGFLSCAEDGQLIRLSTGSHPEDVALRDITCCFTGHRILSGAEREEATRRTDAAIEQAYQQGYRRFLCGGALGYDTLAARCVLAAQTQHPDIRLILVLPCASQSEKWSDADQLQYRRLCYAADEVRLLAEQYYTGCMMVRNRHMVDRSSLCLAWMQQLRGGTLQTVHYALAQEIRVINLFMREVD